MPTVSVVIPTHNRPELVRRSISSVVAQTYTDWELIVVDDGTVKRAKDVVESFNDERIRYIAHEAERGGSAARNTGIKAAHGQFIALLDDDDTWLSEKLAIQLPTLVQSGLAVGFSFTAVSKVMDDRTVTTIIPEGVHDFHERALEYFSGFMTPTILMRRSVFDDIGLFDETLPSHQETDLMIRVTAKYKGLGVNRPLTVVSLGSDYEHVGSDLRKRIAGREQLLAKHAKAFECYPVMLAFHVFRLGLFYRDSGDFRSAGKNFWKAFRLAPRLRYLIYTLSMVGGGVIYRTLR